MRKDETEDQEGEPDPRTIHAVLYRYFCATKLCKSGVGGDLGTAQPKSGIYRKKEGENFHNVKRVFLMFFKLAKFIKREVMTTRKVSQVSLV